MLHKKKTRDLPLAITAFLKVKVLCLLLRFIFASGSGLFAIISTRCSEVPNKRNFNIDLSFLATVN